MIKSPIPFRGFDEHRPVRVYDQGDLPHWRQDGCTYFVTFRLADSLPQRALNEMEYERTLWLKARKIDPADPHWKQLVSMLPVHERMALMQFIEKLLDKHLDACQGSCILQNTGIAGVVASR